MKILKATEFDKKKALLVAKKLPKWFNKEGLKNMKTDFLLNNVMVAKENNQVIGFVCYTSYCGKMLLMWMGVKDVHQRKGIGQKMIMQLEKEAKKLKLHAIELETLPDEDSYEPYQLTRAFYYKNGFKRTLYKKAPIKGWDDQIVLEKKLIVT